MQHLMLSVLNGSIRTVVRSDFYLVDASLFAYEKQKLRNVDVQALQLPITLFRALLSTLEVTQARSKPGSHLLSPTWYVLSNNGCGCRVFLLSFDNSTTPSRPCCKSVINNSCFGA